MNFFFIFVGDELSKFCAPQPKKKSRFQYPEVSKLWFFQQSKDEHSKLYRAEVNIIDNVGEDNSESQNQESQTLEHVEVDGGDEIVFDPNKKVAGTLLQFYFNPLFEFYVRY